MHVPPSPRNGQLLFFPFLFHLLGKQANRGVSSHGNFWINIYQALLQLLFHASLVREHPLWVSQKILTLQMTEEPPEDSKAEQSSSSSLQKKKTKFMWVSSWYHTSFFHAFPLSHPFSQWQPLKQKLHLSTKQTACSLAKIKLHERDFKAMDTRKGVLLVFPSCTFNDTEDWFLPTPPLCIVNEFSIIPSNKNNCNN